MAQSADDFLDDQPDPVAQASARYGIPEERLRAVIDAESGGKERIVSPRGAMGLMQLMPGTARDLGVDAMDPAQNVDGGARYLRQQYDRFGDWDKAHAAYNMGPERVARGDALPPETQGYLRKINAYLGPQDGGEPQARSADAFLDAKPAAKSADAFLDAAPEVPEAAKQMAAWGMQHALDVGRIAAQPAEPKPPEPTGESSSVAMEFGKGMGSFPNKAAKGFNLALGSVPIAMDAIAKAAGASDPDRFKDWWFGHMVAPLEAKEGALGQAADANLPQKIAYSFGNMSTMLATIIGTTPASAPMAASEMAELTATKILGNAADHAARAAIIPGLTDAAEIAQHVYERTGSPIKAANAGSAAYLTTALAFMVPASAEGNLAMRAASGAVGQSASAEAGRVMLNAALPQDMQSPFDPSDLLKNAIVGGAMGAALGHRAAMSPKEAFQRELESAVKNGEWSTSAEDIARARLAPDNAPVEDIAYEPVAPPEPTTSLGAAPVQQDQRRERIRNVQNAITVLEDDLVHAKDDPEQRTAITANLQRLHGVLEDLTYQQRDRSIDMPPQGPLDKASAIEQAIAQHEAAQRGDPNAIPFERVEPPSRLALAPDEAPRGNELDMQPFLHEQQLLRANGISLADWLGQGDILGRPFHPETVDVMAKIDALADKNPAAAAQLGREIDAFKAPKEDHVRPEARPAEAPAPAPDARATQDGLEARPAAEVARAGPGDAAQTRDVASVDAAAHEAATSPRNALPEPTDAQKEAGNYQKGHVRIAGIDISIENPAGSKRRPEWPTMKSHYGYIRGTIGRDKDHVDVFVKPGTRTDWEGPVFVVDQVNPKGRFDEHKVVIGATSMDEAKALYSENYTKGWKVGPVTQMTLPQFRAWTESAFTKRPVKSLSLSEWQTLHQTHERGDQDAELAAAKASLRDTVVRPRYDSLSTVLGKLGGVNLKALTSDGFDPKDAALFKSGVFGHPAIRVKGGYSLDHMAEQLAQHGFDVADEEGRPDQSRVRDLIDEAIEGKPVYAPEGHEFWGARNDMEAYQRERDERGESLLEPQEAPSADKQVERRQDPERRVKVANMTPAEMRHALLTDVLVGIGNRRAWEEARATAPKKHVAALDIDSLGWVNDTLGHAGGDQYLEAVGQALRDEGVEAYRTGGDEIMVQADDQQELRTALAMVRERLASIEVTAIKGDQRITKKGVGFSYGIGPDEKTADDRLYADKRSREDAGLRPPKGREPAGVVRQPAVEAGSRAGEAAAEGQGVAQSLGRYGNSEAFVVPAAQGRGADFALKSPDGQLDLFATSPVSDLPGGARAVYATEVAPARKGEVRSGVERVRSAADAAHVFAGLRKQPREYFAALLLDKDDRPLAYLDLHRGTINQTAVYPGVLAMTAYQTPGAAKVWLTHNHPSGDAEPSLADQTLTRTIREHFDGTGIDYAGHVIIAGSHFHDLEGASDGGERKQPIPPLARTHTIPIMERAVRKDGKLGTAINSPQAAKEMVEQLSNGQEGMLLLDTQMRPVAYLPMALKSAAKLRTGSAESGYGPLVRALGRSNAASAIAYVPHSIEGKEGYRQGVVNLGDALRGLDVRFLDVIAKGDSGSFASRGLSTESGGPFMLRGTGEGMTEQAARKSLADTIQKTRVPIRVHADVDSLRKVPGLEGSPDDAKGAYWNGVIHAVAGAHADALDLQSTIARHEVTHAGIDVLYGSKEARAIALKDLASKNPNLRRAADDWYSRYGEETASDYMKRGASRADAESRARLDAIEEGLAHGAQDIGNTLNGWKAFVATLQKGLRAMGLHELANHLEEASNAEVLAFLDQARRATYESGSPDGGIVPAFARRLFRGVRRTPGDFVVPETPEFDGNMTGDLATITAQAAASHPRIEPLPIRLTVGAVTGPHRGFGLAHMKAEMDAEPRRAPRKHTADLAENFVRDVADIARTGDKLFYDQKTDRIALQGKSGYAIVLEPRVSREGEGTEGRFYSVLTMFKPTDTRKQWGGPVWVGRAALPSIESPKSVAPDLPPGRESRQPDRQPLGVQTEHFEFYTPEKGGDGQPKFARSREDRAPLEFASSKKAAEPPALPEPPREAPKDSLAGDGWSGPDASRFDNLIYTLQDKHIDTKRVVQAIERDVAKKQLPDRVDPYLQEELFHGRAAAGVDHFLSEELKPLLKDMAARGVNMDAFEEWLHARHAGERNAQIAKINPQLPDAGSGMTNAEAKAVLAKARASGMDKPFEALAAKVDAINARTRRLLVAYGLEEPAAVKAWESTYQNYVPLQREDMETGPGIGQGFSVRGGQKRATGSTRAVTNILANVAMQRERAIVRGEKNRVSNAVVGLAQSGPNPDFWQVDTAPTIKTVDPRTGMVATHVDPLYKSRDNVVVARTLDEHGNIVEHAVVFNERDPRAARMAASLKNLDVDKVEGIVAGIGKATRFLSALATQYNPIFGIVNLTRDVQEAALNLTSTPIAGRQKEIVANVLPALRGVYADLRAERKGKPAGSTWAQLFEEFQKEGGKTGYRDMFLTSDARAEALKSELAKSKGGISTKTIGPIANWLSDYNEAIENSVRLSAYKVAIGSGMTKQRAASLAKNLTVNFNRKGSKTSQAGALYAFFNASVQGSARMAQTLAGPSGKAIMAGGVMLGVLQAVALAAAGIDDDDIPEFVRQKNLIIPIGGKKYVTIPMSLGYLVFPNVGRIATELTMKGFKNPGKRVADLLGMALDAFSPIGGMANIDVKSGLQAVTPTPFRPVTALATNQDWTGKPIYREDMNKMHPTPGFTRTKDTATQFSKVMSHAINTMTGGSDYRPGKWSPTADELDFLIGQATGGLGREISKGVQTAGAAFTGEDLPPYKIPLAGRFYGDAGASSSQASKFYDNLKDLAEHGSELKGRRMHGEPTADYMRENPEAKLVPLAEAAEKQVATLRRQKHQLLEKGAPRDQVKALEERTNAVMARFNDRVKEARP